MMLPLWIIDLGSSAASTEKLQKLLSAAGEELKPFWHYCHVEDHPVEDAASCRALMDKLVADGRECYNAFSKAGYQVGTFQIVILGAADEALSQSIFAPLPGLIRDHLPRIISDHANLGVEITGILYIPSTINQSDSAPERARAAMLLEDVNMLNERLGSRHFNRVVAYQDVQYKGVRFYPRLDNLQRTELQYQILIHLFFASAQGERLFDKIGKDCGLFSIGAASVSYNSDQHRAEELKRLLDKILAEFKANENTDEDYAGKIVREVLEEDVLNAESLSDRLREKCGSVDIDLQKIDGEADPHPVWDLFCSDLFPSYYRRFLKYMPARLTRFMQSLSYVLLSRFSAIIRKNCESAVGYFKPLLCSFYEKVLLDSAAQYATIAQLESVYKAAKDFLLCKRAEVALTILEIVPVPQYLRHDYDKCVMDEKANQPSEILENIKKNLKREPIVLSLIVRCFLLGIMLVFTIIPVLRVVSPRVINLGKLATIEWLWIPVIFFLPLIIEFFINLRRHFKRIRRLKYRLLAATLLAVNKRLSQALMDELGAFYDALVEECETQLKRLARFRELLQAPDVAAEMNILPTTMFNQPLLNGQFCGQTLVKDETLVEAEIEVKSEKLRLSELEGQEILSLLKVAFKQPQTLKTADLSDNQNLEEHAMGLIDGFGHHFGPQMQIHTADSIGGMLDLLGKDVDVVPLEKMAGINGMLFSALSNNRPVLRISKAPRTFENAVMIEDAAITSYALLTSWQKISQGFQSQLVCNCSLEPLPALSFADRLSLYYAFFRSKDLAYCLAGTPIRIPKEEMETLDKQIIGG